MDSYFLHIYIPQQPMLPPMLCQHAPHHLLAHHPTLTLAQTLAQVFTGIVDREFHHSGTADHYLESLRDHILDAVEEANLHVRVCAGRGGVGCALGGCVG